MALVVSDGSHLWVCGSCACGCISNLSSERGPEQAMLSFVRKALGATRTKFQKGPVNYSHPYSHYVFVAGPEQKRTESGYWSDYGSSFASYIRKNKLGRVVTLPSVLNTKWHPQTTCQVWLWQPDKQALINWFEKAIEEGLGLRPKAPKAKDICPNCGYYYEGHTDWKCPHDRGVWPE